MSGGEPSGSVLVISLQRMFGRHPRFLARLRDAARFRARSTSHTVAVCDGCTNIPLAAGRAQEDENLSRKRRFRPRLASVRPPGSVRTDHVLRIMVLDSWKTAYRQAALIMAPSITTP